MRCDSLMMLSPVRERERAQHKLLAAMMQPARTRCNNDI